MVQTTCLSLSSVLPLIAQWFASMLIRTQVFCASLLKRPRNDLQYVRLTWVLDGVDGSEAVAVFAVAGPVC